MEKKIVYFEHPWNGPIYAVKVDAGMLPEGVKVKLPDESVIGLIELPGYFSRIVDLGEVERETNFAAKVVIEQGDFERSFEGEWEPLIKFIEICAAVNTLCSIKLTDKEYARLEDGGLEEMEESFSKRAFSLLYLYEEYVLSPDGPSLQLFRTGRC